MHLHKLACSAIVLDDRLGLLVVVAQSPVDRFRPVVCPALELRAPGEPLSRNLV
jgi:hypothetical protein